MKRSLLAVVSIALVLVATPVEARGKAKTACPTAPAVVSHRGGEEYYAENTLNAFRSSTNLGGKFWETDVRFTSDDVPVIMHDATVDRTTNGTGAVSDLTYAEILALRTSDDQPVPTLAEVVNDQSVDKAYAFIELKVAPTEAQWETFSTALLSRAGKGGPQPVITSFDTGVLDEVATRLPGYARGLIQSTGDADPATITPHASILLKHHDSITSARLTKWTVAGLKVYAWADPTADPPSEWGRMTGYSGMVSGYITSTPQAYLLYMSSRVC